METYKEVYNSHKGIIDLRTITGKKAHDELQELIFGMPVMRGVILRRKIST